MNTLNPKQSTITISAINAFSDNYIWAITQEKNHKTALVDPGDADVCIEFLEKNSLTLNSILITHHHADHTGGITKLLTYCQKKQWPLTVYGPKKEAIAHCDIKLGQDDVVHLNELEINLHVIDLPGHTAGHVAFYSSDTCEPSLFCGDTLFSGGCGRLFEGSPEQMLSSLTKLANLPDNTKVYCAHEYTQANLKFALTVEPDNIALKNYNNHVNNLRNNNQTTVPTTIGIEKQINPFLRSAQPEIQTSAKQFDPNTQMNSLDAFTTIRRWKDQF